MIDSLVEDSSSQVSAGLPGAPKLPRPQAAGGLARWLEKGEFVLDSSCCVVDINRSALSWLGGRLSDILGVSICQVLETRQQGWRQLLEPLLGSGGTFSRAEMREGIGADSLWFDVSVTRAGGAFVVRIASILPGVDAMLESSWDAHLKNEGALRQLFVRLARAESQLQQLSSSWPGVIFIQRADFAFDFVSPRMAEFTGIPVEIWRTQAHRFFQVIHEADVDEFKSQLRQAVQTRQLTTTTFRVRNVKTARVAYILEQRRAVVSDQGLVIGYEGAWVDVSRQTVAERRLAAAGWKETLALLTMGLAHDFGNILSGIHSLSEGFLEQAGPEHPFHEGLGLIKQNSMQATQLIHRIMHLHRGQVGQRSYGDLSDMAREASDLMKKVVNRRVQIELETHSNPLPVYIDEVEFRQVIINLMLNASDAMPNGGKLFLATSHHESFPPLDFIQGTLPKLPAVCLAIGDTGIGIQRNRFQSIFDPFFTTKALKKGSGLGLYNVTLFLEKHRGAISLESTEGVGTTFKIWLSESDFTEAEQRSGETETHRRSLLLIGAHGALLESTSELLRLHGYCVVTSEELSEAGDLLCSPDYSFSGVMMVLEARDPSAESFLSGIKRQNPSIKAVLHLTGCNQDELDTSFVKRLDLVVSSDTSEQDLLARLDEVYRLYGKEGE